MANLALDVAAATTVTGNAVTVTGSTLASTGTGTLTCAAISAKKMDMFVVGQIHGFLRFPFADPDTLDGALQPADLRTAQIKLTQGGADAVLALIVEELYVN